MVLDIFQQTIQKNLWKYFSQTIGVPLAQALAGFLYF